MPKKTEKSGSPEKTEISKTASSSYTWNSYVRDEG